LVDRLKSVKEQFQEKQSSLSWDELISKVIGYFLSYQL